MNNIKNFLDMLSKFDPQIKEHIDKMNLPYPLLAYADSKKNISVSVTEFLSTINQDLPKTFHNAIPYLIGELTDNLDQHSQYSHAYVFLKVDENKELNIVIFDDSLTIPTIFEKSNVSFTQNSLAIKMALEGRTTKKEDIKRGFGLRTTKAIVNSLNGEMKIFYIMFNYLGG